MQAFSTRRGASECSEQIDAPSAAWADAAHQASLRARRRRWASARAAGLTSLRRRGAALFACLMFLGAGAASAEAPSSVLKVGSTGTTVQTLQRALGVPADGVYGPQTRRAVKRYQRRHGLAVDGIAGPATLRSLGIRVRPSRRSAPSRTSDSSPGPRVLQRIAQCESGGNPRAISPDGRYRGKYQFSRATWRALGGKGDPAKAPETEQDRLAAKLYASQGTSPWPSCGR